MERDNILYKARRKLQRVAYRVFSKKLLSGMYYAILLKKLPDIKSPKTFNEKLQWLKLNYYPYVPLVSFCTDKYSSRQYVKDKGYEHLLTKIYGVWQSPEDINWEDLPHKFVLKCTHGCAYNIFCTDKESINKKDVCNTLKKWMKEDFAVFNVEPHYSKITPRIICEEHLGEIMIDYKFFCFNGKPEFFYVSSDFAHDRQCKIGFFDMNGKRIPLVRKDYGDIGDIELVDYINEMAEVAKELSKDFPFVRVDFFICENKFKFSELTFTPSAAMMPICPQKYDDEWGDLLKLPPMPNKSKIAHMHSKENFL